MFWLVETQDQYESFKDCIGQEIFAIPVYRHPEIHPGIYSPICLYVKDLRTEKSYLINFSHPEALSFDILQVKDFLKLRDKIYVLDKKAFNYFCFSDNTYDLLLTGKVTPSDKNYTVSYYTQKFYEDIDLNLIIPIVKHFEECEEIYVKCKTVISNYQLNTHNQEISDVFWFIERNALKVNSAFERHFDLKRPYLSKYKTWVFTEYNLNTLTGRPSNTFNTINFAALNKDNGCRSVFIPRNDFFLEIDLTAYHPALISEMVGYKSPNRDIYIDFAQQYNMDRSEAKNLVFKQLYGHVYDDYKDFEFFELTQKEIERIWKVFTAEGKIIIEQTGKVFYEKDLPNMNPQKLFNYIIQHTETFNNVALLKDILYILSGCKTQIVLYVYDAFVIDVSKEDKDKIRQVLEVFENRGLTYKIKKGVNYGEIE